MKVILFLLFIFSSGELFALNKMKKNEYLITSTKNFESKDLADKLHSHPAQSLEGKGKNQWVIQFKSDPGLNALKSMLSPDFKVQSNYLYKAQ